MIRRRVSGFRGQVIGIVLTAYALHLLGYTSEFTQLGSELPPSWEDGRGFSELTRCTATNYFIVGQLPTEYLLFVKHIANPFNYSRDLFVLVVESDE